MQGDVREAFHPLARAIDNWRPHIFAYFDHRVTNAYTESLNNLIRVMNRLGRGYSFEALRAKILFAEGSHKVKRPNFHRRRPDMVMSEALMARSTRYMLTTTDEDQEINYGADLSTLVKLIEEGAL